MLDENSGGHTIYISPGLRLSQGNLSAYASVGIPVLKDENEYARRAAVELLLARYNQDNLAENSPRDPTGDTAYSLNKGAIVAICLRDRTRPDSIHDIEILTFVTLHDMPHIAIV